MSISTGQVSNLVATIASGGPGKPVITPFDTLFTPTDAPLYVGNNYLGSGTLLRYDIPTGTSATLGFVEGTNVIGVAGYGTPAVDQDGNAYVTVNRSESNLPYSDFLVSVSPAGVMTKRHWFLNVQNGNRDTNTFSGLVFDPVRQLIYGSYYEVGADDNTGNPGTLFCFNPATNNFAGLFRFNGTDGSLPVGDLAIDATGTHLYGVTTGGGRTFDGSNFASGAGEIFELSLGSTPPC